MINKNIYLSSYEYDSFAVPRRILNFKWGAIENRDCLVAEVDLPINGELYGLPNRQITSLYILNRFEQDLEAFRNLNPLPIEVHILIRKSDEVIGGDTAFDQFKHIVWATIYDKLDDAKQRKPPNI